MKIDCAHDSLVDVDKLLLIQNPKNNNKHSKEQIERLAKIIDFQGQRHPIVVSNRSGFITKGHGRLMAIHKLGWKQAAVDYQDYISEAQEYADMTADNEIARWAEFDSEKFLNDIKDIDLGDIELLGLKEIPEILNEKEGLTDPDDVPEVAQNIHNVQLGQMWKLGEHRLMCGDSTDIATVEKLMDSEKADMVFTDPPYGVSYTGGLQDKGTGLKGNARQMIKNDDIDLYEDAVKIASVFCIGPVFMFYADTVPFGLYRGIEQVGGEVVALIIWKKKGGYGALGASYKPNHEPCVIWKQKKHKLNFIGDTTENRVWEEDKEGINKLHPTQKPVSIPERAIKNHEGPNVLDLFGGSGSTLIACEKTNRKCFMMELDPHYCSVIIERWQKFTGKKAELING